jgi:diguanylate cyclase (GGDEF)-like protein
MTIAKAVGASRRFEDVLELAAEEACTAMGAASLSISRWERDREVLRTLINVGDLAPCEERFPADETYDLRPLSWYWEILVSGGIVRRRAGEPVPPGTVDLVAQLGKDSEMACAIMFEGDLWGELWATTAVGQEPFSAEDEEFLRAVASQVAAGLASAAYLARLETLAFTDPLTGLANRRGLDERLGGALEEGRDLAVVVCDVDGLKEINDRDGHSAGDAALVAVAAALRAALDTVPGALAARIGGDEFCLLVPGDAETARGVARQALGSLAARGVGVSMSCGIASTAVARDASGLLAAADAAQYGAKHAGVGLVLIAGRDQVPATAQLPTGRRRLRDRAAALVELLGAPDETPVGDLVQRVLNAARDQLGMDLAFVGQFTGDDGLTFRYVEGIAEVLPVGEGQRLPAADTLCQGVREVHGPFPLPDVRAEPRFRDLRVARDGDVGAYVGVPVVLDDGRLYGTLCCVDRRARQRFDEREIRFLRVLASIVAGIVQTEAAQAEDRERARRRVGALLEAASLSMLFQPVRDLRTGMLVGVEALARFRVAVGSTGGRDPTPDSTAPPDRWFAEAADVGLGVDLELAALEAALAALPHVPWNAFLAVNVSPATLCSPRLAQAVAGVAPGRLVLELTEHAPVADYDDLAAALAGLRVAGARIAVDDVGAGYASLAHLLRLAPDIVKLDLQFTRGIDVDPVRRSLAAALRDVAAGMGATIVAEGIETAEEVATLIGLGVSLGQGHRLGRPGSLADLSVPAA